MNKFVAWLIALGLIAVVAYAIASGLYNDVITPFRPPNP